MEAVMIPRNFFGRTGHESTRAVFGAAALSRVTQEEADQTLKVLLQYGINHIDVAAGYGDAELRIVQKQRIRKLIKHGLEKRKLLPGWCNFRHPIGTTNIAEPSTGNLTHHIG